MNDQLINMKYVISAVVYSGIGLIIMAFAFWVFDKMTPGHLWKEIVEEHNVALAITAGATILAIAQIIASAIHG
jgi:putative membrane protein